MMTRTTIHFAIEMIIDDLLLIIVGFEVTALRSQ